MQQPEVRYIFYETEINSRILFCSYWSRNSFGTWKHYQYWIIFICIQSKPNNRSFGSWRTVVRRLHFCRVPHFKRSLPAKYNWLDCKCSVLDCPLLETLVLEQGFNCELILTTNSQLSTESLVGIIDALADLNGQTSKRLVLGNINLNKLTAEQKAIATNKNWAIN